MVSLSPCSTKRSSLPFVLDTCGEPVRSGRNPERIPRRGLGNEQERFLELLVEDRSVVGVEGRVGGLAGAGAAATLGDGVTALESPTVPWSPPQSWRQSGDSLRAGTSTATPGASRFAEGTSGLC